MLQAAMSKRVVLKYTPQLHFKIDEAIERGTRVIDILEKIDIPDED
jgi:ribosome-binding factor A